MENLKIKADSRMVAVWMVEPDTALTKRQIDIRAKKYLEIDAQIKELQSQLKSLKAELLERTPLGGSECSCVAYGDRYEVSLTRFSESRIDTARLKAELPEVAEQYTKTSDKSRFSVKVH